MNRRFAAQRQGNIEIATDFKAIETRWCNPDDLKGMPVEG
jgi:hypothetical protein